jgi:sugar/nucleoside kinase (ribokinase family)
VEPTVEWDVVVVGGINTDYLIRAQALPGAGMSLGGDMFLEAPGGKGANAAVAAARLGARTALVEWIPELPAKRIDATGAGDAFAGGLAVALAEHLTLPDAARFASGVAALKTTALGAQTALPHRRELHAYLDHATSMQSRDSNDVR